MSSMTHLSDDPTTTPASASAPKPVIGLSTAMYLQKMHKLTPQQLADKFEIEDDRDRPDTPEGLTVARDVPGTIANTALQRIHQRATQQSTVPSSESSGPVRRFLRGAGVPTSVPELYDTALQLAGPSGPIIGAATGHPVPNPAVAAFNAVGSGIGDQAGQALDAVQQHDAKGFMRHSLGAAVPLVGPQLAEGNVAGAMGTTAALLAPMIAGKGMRAIAARKSTVPVQVEMPNPGPVRQVIGNLAGFVMPEKLHSALKPLWNGGGTRTIRVPISDVPPRVTGTGTDFPLEPKGIQKYFSRDAAIKAEAVGAESPPHGSPVLRHPDDWYRPVPEAAYGDAPIQPLIQPKTIGPEFDPRTPTGAYAPRKSVPLVGDRQSTVPVSGFSPAPGSSIPTSAASSVPSAPSAATEAPSGLVGQSVRFSRGASRSHGTVLSVRGDVARVSTNRLGASVRVPVSQLTILQKASTASSTVSTVPGAQPQPQLQLHPLSGNGPERGENHDMFVNVNPVNRLPERFVHARTALRGSPVHPGATDPDPATDPTLDQFSSMEFESNNPGRKNIGGWSGLYGRAFETKARANQTEDANTILLSRAADDSWPEVMAHEEGHAAWNDITDGEKHAWETLHHKLYKLGAPLAGENAPAARAASFLGDDPTETFAEVFGQYQMNPTALRAEDAQVYGYFKKLFDGREYIQPAKTGNPRPPRRDPREATSGRRGSLATRE